MEGKEPFEDVLKYPIGDELDLHTFQAKDVKSVVEEYLFQCRKKGLSDALSFPRRRASLRWAGLPLYFD